MRLKRFKKIIEHQLTLNLKKVLKPIIRWIHQYLVLSHNDKHENRFDDQKPLINLKENQ